MTFLQNENNKKNILIGKQLYLLFVSYIPSFIFSSNMYIYFADPGEARVCSTNSIGNLIA